LNTLRKQELLRLSIQSSDLVQRLFPTKTTLAIVTFVAMLLVPEFIPQLNNLKPLEWRAVPMALDFVPGDLAPEPADVLQLAPPTLHDSARNLDSFYEALSRAEAGRNEGIVRILHYGDSPTTADLITSDTRILLQERFGNAGHGFHLIAKPWTWYEHRGIRLDSAGWSIDPATQPSLADGVYGLGGVSFRGATGAKATLQIREPDLTQIELSYLAMPGGGKVVVAANDREMAVIDTAGPGYSPAWAKFAVPEGAREVQILVTESHVRLFGINLEKTSPGVVYHSLGLNGAYVSVLARMFKEQHWIEQLRHYRPDLVIINYGTNESVYKDFIERAYARELEEVIRRVRTALPEVSILIMSPMDRGTRDERGSIGTVPVLPRLVAMQERLAAENACAFFNTFEAMGGPGTMGRWYRTEPRLVGADFIHPLPAGARIVGELVSKSIIRGYESYKKRSRL
jgi:lysophospholipase L1-like esterase